MVKEVVCPNCGVIIPLETGEEQEPDIRDMEGEEVTYKVEDWFADKEGIPKIISGTIERETDKAVLLTKDELEIWLPKSQIKEVEEDEPEDQSKLNL